MKEKKAAPRLTPAYGKPRLVPLNRPARGRGDCVSGSGDAVNCFTGTNTDNCAAGTDGGA